MAILKLPSQYIVDKFHQYSNKVTFHKTTNSYKGGFIICKEGKSWSRKTRLNYYVDDNFIICYNCNRTWNPLYWIKEVSGHTIRDIITESQDYDSFNTINFEETTDPKPKNIEILPVDSINLSDEVQIKYYSDNQIIIDALAYIKNRRLDTAINKCTFWISLKDYLHKNRLVIPFQDSDKKIRFYQSRALYKKDEYCKYLSKLNADKTVFGLNTIDESLDYLFIFEGPIDSLFCKNGISMAGLKISEHQKELLNKYFLYERIWVLDNQLDNPDVKKKNLQLVEDGERIFIWPKEYKDFKDVNELCCKFKKDFIKPEFFIKNSYKGLEAKTLIELNSRNLK